jgi:hypothetical protein
MQTTPEPDEFAGIATSAECVVVARKLFGIEFARFMIETVDPERRSLQRMARELRAGGAVDLAEMAAKVAKTAPLGPLTFKERLARRERAERRAKRQQLSYKK